MDQQSAFEMVVSARSYAWVILSDPDAYKLLNEAVVRLIATTDVEIWSLPDMETFGMVASARWEYIRSTLARHVIDLNGSQLTMQNLAMLIACINVFGTVLIRNAGLTEPMQFGMTLARMIADENARPTPQIAALPPRVEIANLE